MDIYAAMDRAVNFEKNQNWHLIDQHQKTLLLLTCHLVCKLKGSFNLNQKSAISVFKYLNNCHGRDRLVPTHGCRATFGLEEG